MILCLTLHMSPFYTIFTLIYAFLEYRMAYEATLKALRSPEPVQQHGVNRYLSLITGTAPRGNKRRQQHAYNLENIINLVLVSFLSFHSLSLCHSL